MTSKSSFVFKRLHCAMSVNVQVSMKLVTDRKTFVISP